MRTRTITLLAAVALAMAATMAACAERTIKAAGQECSATSECESGLLCDFAADPPVCAGEGSGPLPMADGGTTPADAAVAIDAAADAAAVDAAAAAP